MNELLELTIERPVAGGRMLARDDAGVVLVAGTLPGERVTARVTRRARQVRFAETVDVLQASPDRRQPTGDPWCGGSTFAHIRYERQMTLKAEIVQDAFRRIGRLSLEAPPIVAPSPETGYRMRATLHVGDGKVGFYREGTRVLCDAEVTGQLLPETMRAVRAVADALGSRLSACAHLVVAENVVASERVIHLSPSGTASLDGLELSLAGLDGVTGVTADAAGRPALLAGSPTVSDSAADVFGSDSPTSGLVAWTRHATSFFQGNRFLLGTLVRRVLEAARGDRVVDLYAGVGLFAVALAAGGASVVAVEGDRSAAADLKSNAGPWRDRLLVVGASVETAVAEVPAGVPDVVIVDPPRTGMSADGLTGLLAWRVPRLVYVSCDPPTLARDARRLVGAGYVMRAVEAFDLFPNTPHVETIAVFECSD